MISAADYKLLKGHTLTTANHNLFLNIGKRSLVSKKKIGNVFSYCRETDFCTDYIYSPISNRKLNVIAVTAEIG